MYKLCSLHTVRRIDIKYLCENVKRKLNTNNFMIAKKKQEKVAKIIDMAFVILRVLVFLKTAFMSVVKSYINRRRE